MTRSLGFFAAPVETIEGAMEHKVDIPDKLYFKIGEVAEIAGIEPHVLRYWESEFSVLKPHRANKQRLYRKGDIENIFKIKDLLYEKGFTISGARKALRQSKKVKDEAIAPVEARPLFESVKEQLSEIKRLLENN